MRCWDSRYINGFQVEIGSTGVGPGYEFDAIADVSSMASAYRCIGKCVEVVIGATIIGTINNGMDL